MATFGAFWALSFAVWMHVLLIKSSALDLKSAAKFTNWGFWAPVVLKRQTIRETPWWKTCFVSSLPSIRFLGSKDKALIASYDLLEKRSSSWEIRWSTNGWNIDLRKYSSRFCASTLDLNVWRPQHEACIGVSQRSQPFWRNPRTTSIILSLRQCEFFGRVLRTANKLFFQYNATKETE